MPTQADRSSIDSIGSLLVWMLNHLINMILMHPGGGGEQLRYCEMDGACLFKCIQRQKDHLGGSRNRLDVDGQHVGQRCHPVSVYANHNGRASLSADQRTG